MTSPYVVVKFVVPEGKTQAFLNAFAPLSEMTKKE